MKLRNRILKALFPPRHWHIVPLVANPPIWWVEGRSLIGRRYQVGPFFSLTEALERCSGLNGLRQ